MAGGPGVGGGVADVKVMQIWFQAQVENANASIKKLEGRIRGLKGHITKLNKHIGGQNQRIKDMSRGVNKARGAYGRFLGTMLSLLFISQGVSAALGRMMDPILQATGFFDIWRATMISLLAPAMIPVIQGLIKLMTWFINLPKPVKKVIGWVIILGFVFFKLLGIMAQLFLFLGSLGLPTLMATGSWLKAVAAGWKLLVSPITKATGAILGFLKASWAAHGILAGTVSIIAGVVAVFVGLWRIITGFFTSNTWKVFSGALLVIAGVIALVLGGWIPALIVAIVALLVWLGDKFKIVRTILYTLSLPLKFLIAVIFGIIKALKTWSLQPLLDIPKATLKDTFLEPVGKAIGLASGGIVTRPTLAMIGEGGPEAVIPLDGSGFSSAVINININGSFQSRTDMNSMIQQVQTALREELRRLALR